MPSAKALYENSENAVIIIDVREVESAANSKFESSVNISRGLIEMKVQKLCPAPDTLILLHCVGGGRAALTALTL